MPSRKARDQYWKTPEREHLLLRVAFAQIPPEVLKEHLDYSELARMLGDGKLTEKSAR